MQLAAGHDLSVSFVTRELFSGLDFTIQNTSHIGLVGMNGCGKTTLFKVMCGQLQPDSGSVAYSRETRLAYMEQFLLADEATTLYEAVAQVFAGLSAIENRLNEINEQLELAPTPALLEEQQRLQEQYADQGGYTYCSRLRSTLLGLGFAERDFALPVRALSGGQRSKAALAKVLLTESNLLLLDEPTNHLDINSIEWLEGYLANYRGAFIVISHDRYFLDKVTNETWALEHGTLRCFKGNYSQHLEKKESEDQSLLRRYQNQLREIRRIEAIIAQQKRFNQARNYVTIASKQKQIDRLKADLRAPEAAAKTLGFSFSTPPPGGNDVLELHEVAKGFGSKKLFAHVNMHVQKGERIFLLGPNGCGKTTLMRIIMGQETADSGMVKLGANIIPAYYDQLQTKLKGSESILEHMTNCYPRLTQTRIRTMLVSFLFPGESVEKSINELSGGERARLELMKLILYPANFLLLDEPSNHLDIESREAVEEALLNYPGAMLVISHDRYLINRLADRIYLLTTEGLQEYLGNYDDYLEQLNKSGDQTQSPLSLNKNIDTVIAEKPAVAQEEEKATSAAEEYRRRKEEQAEARRIQKKQERLKLKIAELEEELETVSDQIDACAPEDYQLLMEFVADRDRLENEILDLMEEAEQLKALAQPKGID